MRKNKAEKEPRFFSCSTTGQQKLINSQSKKEIFIQANLRIITQKTVFSESSESCSEKIRGNILVSFFCM